MGDNISLLGNGEWEMGNGKWGIGYLCCHSTYFPWAKLSGQGAQGEWLSLAGVAQ